MTCQVSLDSSVSRGACQLQENRWVTGGKKIVLQSPETGAGQSLPSVPAVFQVEAAAVHGTAERHRLEGRGGRPAGPQPRRQPPQGPEKPPRALALAPAARSLGERGRGVLHTAGGAGPVPPRGTGLSAPADALRGGGSCSRGERTGAARAGPAPPGGR